MPPPPPTSLLHLRPCRVLGAALCRSPRPGQDRSPLPRAVPYPMLRGAGSHAATGGTWWCRRRRCGRRGSHGTGGGGAAGAGSAGCHVRRYERGWFGWGKCGHRGSHGTGGGGAAGAGSALSSYTVPPSVQARWSCRPTPPSSAAPPPSGPSPPSPPSVAATNTLSSQCIR